jgi:hypothetical protein
MPAAIKYNDYVEQLSRGVHNWATHTFRAALLTTAPDPAEATLAATDQIATGGGYTGGAGGGQALDTVALSEAAGTAQVTVADEVFVAGVGGFAPFRGVAIYNDTPTSPADPLVLGWDYGSTLTLAEGETFTIDFSSNLWTLA